MFLRRTRHRVRQRHPLAGVLRLVFMAFAMAICAAGGFMLGAMLAYVEGQPTIGKLEYYSPRQVTRVYARDGARIIAEFYDQKREVLHLSEMPTALPQAFIAIEDARFRSHFGVDPKGILRALVINARHGSIRQGGSTITQQLTRNILPATVGKSRNIARKIREALGALVIERRYSKDQVVEFYLNHIFLGYNSYGVQSAAHTYFNKDARDLNIAECAALAAIPKAPSRLNPRRSPERLRKRRDLVLRTMAELGYITPETAEEEIARPLATHGPSRPRVASPYYVDRVQRELADDPDLEDDLLNRGGYAIHTAEDPTFQQVLEDELTSGLVVAETLWHLGKGARKRYEDRDIYEQFHTLKPLAGQTRLAEIVARRPDGVEVEIQGYRGLAPYPRDRYSPSEDAAHLPYHRPDWVLRPGGLLDVRIESVDSRAKTMTLSMIDRTCIQGAAVLLDAATGQVMALTGGSDFYDRANNGMWNRATRGGRQPGSAFKPLLYATALQTGDYTAGSVIMDDRLEFPNGYVPRNYENRYFGPMTLYEALAHSNNVVTIELFRALGFSTARKGYRAFDIVEPKPTWQLPPEMPLCLGTLNMTPLALAAAYATFPRGGIVAEPRSVTEVRDLDGRLVKRMRAREKRILSPQAAYITTDMLVAVVREGTGRSEIGQHLPYGPYPRMGGKTGTTSDCVDAWFAGFTPELVLVVYVGFDQVRTMGVKMTGSRVAGPIWRRMMQRILDSRPGQWKMDFDVPPNIEFHDISSRTGLLASPAGTYGDERILRNIPFRKGKAPVDYSMGYGGRPYWRDQHPDPEKNQALGPDYVPDDVAWAVRPDAQEASPLDTGPIGQAAVPPPPERSRDRIDDGLLAPPW